MITVPWGGTAVRHRDGGIPASAVRVVIAVDRNGLLAIACYAVASEGLALDAFDLIAPFTATPVLRGTQRVKPGEPQSAAAPIALGRKDGVLDVAVGVGATADGEAVLGSWLREYEPTSDLERSAPLPVTLVGVQRAGSSWAELSGAPD